MAIGEYVILESIRWGIFFMERRAAMKDIRQEKRKEGHL